jgi:AMP nucleosidase
MVPEGVKTEAGDRETTKEYAREHLSIGVAALEDLIATGESVKHLRF